MILGVLLTAHYRPLTLDIVLSELLRYQGPDLTVKICLLLDRPTASVSAVVEKYRERIFKILDCPFPIVSPAGERWMEARNLQLEPFQHTKVDWLYLQDDDRWLEPLHAKQEILTSLSNPDIDVWYANSLFMWDRPDKYNPARHHFSPVFWRFKAADVFPPNRVIQATEQVHDASIITGRASTLRIPLLDYGSLNTLDRIRLYHAFEEAGRVDPYIDVLIAPSTAGLRSFPEDAVKAGFMPDSSWRDLYTERLQDA